MNNLDTVYPSTSSSPGMNLITYATIELMKPLLMQADGLVHTPQDLAAKACEYAKAAIRVSSNNSY